MNPQDCCPPSAGGTHLLPWRQALDLMLAPLEPVGDTEVVPTAAGLGRVLAAPVSSTIEVPGWDNSAMDGSACRHAALAATGGRLRFSANGGGWDVDVAGLTGEGGVRRPPQGGP